MSFRERFEGWRNARELDDDEPGAPPGFLLDDDDDRSHEHVDLVDATRWDLPDRSNALARGDGED